MADGHDHNAEQEREENERARQRRTIEQSVEGKKEGSIWDAIVGFLKFLFEIFFPSKEAPNEEPEEGQQAPRETTMDRVRMGQLIIEKQAIPKWNKFQQDNKDKPVEFISPVVGKSVVTSGFGHRHAPIKGASTNHAGVDLGARGGDSTPDIVASASGIVLFSGRKQGYGHTVIIGHADGSYTLYGHMSGHKMPEIGSEVQQGQQIGIMGKSGTATGVHLHYEQRKGADAIEPRIGGVVLKEGVTLAGAETSRITSLVNPKNHPTLAMQDGGTPTALARAGVAGAKVTRG